MSVTTISQDQIARRIADRVEQARLGLGWSQAELAERAGIALSTYRKFEQTGQVSLERLIRVSLVLGRGDEWQDLLAPEPPRSIEDVVATWQVRQRGRRRQTKHRVRSVRVDPRSGPAD